MHTATIVTSVIVILAGILPFVIIGRSGKKTKNKFLQLITFLAEKNNAKATDYELVNSVIIAFDPEKGLVFFIKKQQNQFLEQTVNLHEMQKCKVVKHLQEKSNSDSNTEVINKIELVFNPKTKPGSEKHFIFYNSDYDGLMIVKELLAAENWANKLNQFIEPTAQKK